MRIGILGSGQLGRMLALAGEPLGHSFIFFDKEAGESTRGIGETLVGDFSDNQSLSRFAQSCDVVTYEFENVPCEAAHYLANLLPVLPPPRALEVSQDRVIEKEFLNSLGIETPPFQAVSSEDELRRACQALGLPCVVKTRRMGYDGKGQTVIRRQEDITDAWRLLGHAPLIVEGFVPFSRELSVIAARDKNGAIVTYPLAHNTHRSGILYRTELPAPNVSPALERDAQSIIARALNELSYIGILTIELFEVHGKLIANEMAPRVHNSGHITIDNTRASQFENHIRAVSGMSLGSPEAVTRGVMYNLIGRLPPSEVVTRIPSARVHQYGKSERKGRKIGHINLLKPSETDEATVAELVSRSNEL